MIRASLALLCVVVAVSAHAHHGVAGVGAAALEGPGAPVESATSATLPEGSTLLYLKIDHARYRTFDGNPAAPESRYANFLMAGIGYGFTPWFSGYVFLPWNHKADEPGGFTTRGFADMSLFGQMGFKYDKGLRLKPAEETLDDLEDWNFTVYGGATLPTGNPNLRDGAGAIDPGKSTGFGKPSFNIGLTATRMFRERWTANFELAHLRFIENTYADGNRTKFGAEYRANAALFYRAWTDAERRMRLDFGAESQFLRIGRDRTNGAYDAATGGDIVYLVPGARLYWGRASAALGFKKPVWTQLNESPLQQGAEGKERYRIIFSLSFLL